MDNKSSKKEGIDLNQNVDELKKYLQQLVLMVEEMRREGYEDPPNNTLSWYINELKSEYVEKKAKK